MSSKSKKHSSPPARKQGGSTQAHSKSAHEGELEHAEPTAKDFLEAEELLHTPKGKNPFVFAGLILLMIFLLIIFILPPGLLNGSGRNNPVVVRYEVPGVGLREVSAKDAMILRRDMTNVMNFYGQNSRPNVEELGRRLLLDDLAKQSGITVSDEEIGTLLAPAAQALGSQRALTQRLNNFNGGAPRFVDTLRMMMRAERYEQLLRKLGTVPSADSLREAWDRDHQEYAFDYVVAEVEEYIPAAESEEPDDATLSAWLDAQPPFKKREFEVPETFGVDMLALDLSAGPATEESLAALFAAYPTPEDWDADAKAQAYYDRSYFMRFVKPEDEAAETEEDEVTTPAELYLPFDEVKDLALLEARAMDSMQRWLEEQRTAISTAQAAVPAPSADPEALDVAPDEETLAALSAAAMSALDLSAEAARLGLTYVPASPARTQVEWRETDGLTGPYLAGGIRRLISAGDLLDTIVVESQALLAPRLTERNPAALRPLDEIRDDVLAGWAKERALELAKEDLELLRADLADVPSDEAAPADEAEAAEGSDEVAIDESEGTAPEGDGDVADGDLALEDDEDFLPEEEAPLFAGLDAFTAAAQNRGFEVRRREWLDRRAVESDDPNWNEPANTFLRSRFQLYQLEENGIDDVTVSSDQSAVYLSRTNGSRSVPIESMSPKDYSSLMQSAQTQAQFGLLTGGPLSEVELRERYKLQFPDLERQQAEEAAAAEAAGEADTSGTGT